MVTLGPFSDQDHKGLSKSLHALVNPSGHFPVPTFSKGRIEQGLPATLVCHLELMTQAGQGAEDQRESLTRVRKFQETPNKHCEQPAACMVQAHCESTEGSEEQAVTGHVSRSSSFWAQFHLLPSAFILSGLQRLGSWEALRDTGLGPPFFSCTSP